MKSSGFTVCLYTVVFFLAAVSLFAQEYRSSILGKVTDSTGAAVAGARVTVVNTDTNVQTTTPSNAEGDYEVPFLEPGNYRIRVEAAAFKAFERSAFQLRLNERIRMDAALEVGAVTESVTVSGTAPLLETETAVAGSVLEGTVANVLPVTSKKVYQVMYYVPGLNSVGYNAFSSLGLADREFEYSIDGVTAKQAVLGVVTNQSNALQPSLEGIAEVKVMTTGMSAEYGHASAGMLTVVMKTGTNQVHGSAEDRFTLVQLIHRQYFDVLPQTPPYYVHIISGTIGGPVYIPKIYNGKNRTFFFGSVMYTRQISSNTGIADVPSAAMLNGDFSFGGLGQPIYDPSSTYQNAAGTWLRTQFPGNQIPKSRFDPVAVKFLSYNPWRSPNVPGYTDALGTHNNVQQLVFAFVNRPYFDAKIDHQISANNRIMGRYSENFIRGWNRTDTPVLWDLESSSMAGQPIVNMTNAVVSNVYIINPSTINEIKFGYNRRTSNLVPASVGQGWAATLGIPNVGSQAMPDFRTSTGALYYSAGMGPSVQEVGEDITLQESVTKVKGSHSIKFGYELKRSRYNAKNGEYPSGQYYMGGTGMPFVSNTGNDFASFLLGAVTQATFSQQEASWLPRWWSHGLYVQDDFKVSRTLTLNLGLRWSYESPFETKYGQQSQFDPNAIDPLTGLKGAITHPKTPLAARDLNNFQPRVGLAWNFAPKLAFRGSFGILAVDLLSDSTYQNSEEYIATATVQEPAGNPSIAFLLSQGPPKINFVTNPDGSVPYQGTNYSSRTASWYDPHMRDPYVMNWSEGFQWQIAPTWLAEANYQGSAGVGLRGSVNINVLPQSIYNSTNLTLLNQVYQATQNYLPYPQFGAINFTSNLGHETYHALQTRVEKRYARGLTLQASWSWSKNLTGAAGTGWEYYDWNLTKARSSNDLTHRLMIEGTYELPFGHGRHWLSSATGLKDKLAGGWILTIVQLGQTGHPISVTYAGSPYHYLPGPSLPIQVVPNSQAQVQNWSIGPNREPVTAQNPYLNISAFTYPAAFTPGTLGTNTFTGPHVIWAQWQLEKSVKVTERITAFVRWEMSNPYKYNNFTIPNPSYNLQSPGSFARNYGIIDNWGSMGGRLMSWISLRMTF